MTVRQLISLPNTLGDPGYMALPGIEVPILDSNVQTAMHVCWSTTPAGSLGIRSEEGEEVVDFPGSYINNS